MSSSSTTTKRRRTTKGIGAPSEADSPTSQIDAPSSSAYSTRRVLTTGVPSLSSICISVYVQHFHLFSQERDTWKPNPRWKLESKKLALLPDALLHRVFNELSVSCPRFLTSDLIKENFLRGNSITVSNDYGERLPKSAIATIPSLSTRSSVVSLSLLGCGSIEDRGFALVVSSLPSLQVLRLRGCTLVGFKTVNALVEHCPSLESINLSYTSVTPQSLAPLIRERKDKLRVLKMAIPSWTDAMFAKLLDELPMETTRLPILHTLKLRQTALSDVSFNAILPCCPNLRRLDMSFTRVRRLSDSALDSFHALEKLSLTSTDINRVYLSRILLHSPNLAVLNIGALGSNRGQAPSLGNTMALTMTDDYLDALTKILETNLHLTSLSLVGNSKIGQRRQPISEFMYAIGRRLKKLNLTGLTYLRSSDLTAFGPEDSPSVPLQLEALSLSRTSVDDAAAPYLANCESLRALEVAGTRFTSEGLFTIIDGCPRLDRIDLTSCRSIQVAARRHFFEEWERERGLKVPRSDNTDT